MSLLMDALKKAEQAQQSTSTSHLPTQTEIHNALSPSPAEAPSILDASPSEQNTLSRLKEGSDDLLEWEEQPQQALHSQGTDSTSEEESEWLVSLDEAEERKLDLELEQALDNLPEADSGLAYEWLDGEEYSSSEENDTELNAESETALELDADEDEEPSSLQADTPVDDGFIEPAPAQESAKQALSHSEDESQAIAELYADLGNTENTWEQPRQGSLESIDTENDSLDKALAEFETELAADEDFAGMSPQQSAQTLFQAGGHTGQSKTQQQRLGWYVGGLVLVCGLLGGGYFFLVDMLDNINQSLIAYNAQSASSPSTQQTSTPGPSLAERLKAAQARAEVQQEQGKQQNILPIATETRSEQETELAANNPQIGPSSESVTAQQPFVPEANFFSRTLAEVDTVMDETKRLLHKSASAQTAATETTRSSPGVLDKAFTDRNEPANNSAPPQKAQVIAPHTISVETVAKQTILPNREDFKVVRGKQSSREQFSTSVNEAYAAYQRGDLRSAEQQYRALQNIRANNRDVLLGLAAIAVRRGQTQDALRQYQHILDLYPQDQFAQTSLISLLGQQQGAEGESLLKAFLNEHAESAHLHFVLGNLYSRQGRWAEAQQAYFDAYQRDTEQADYACNLAISLDRLGKATLALRYYEKALTLSGHRPAQFNPAQIRQRVQQLNDAESG